MSTADPYLGVPSRRRIGITADPSEDELAQHSSLSPADLREISRCRGADHKRRYALQLCMLRIHGRFLDDYRQAPLRIVDHLSRQLGLAPVLFLGPPEREPTEREQAQRMRRYLGLASFDQSAAIKLRNWLRQGAAEGRGAVELLVQAEDKLRSWRIILPAPGTVERIVNSVVAQAPAELFETVATRLPAKLRESIDLLLEVPRGDARSSLFRLKDYPRAPSARVIKGAIVRLHLIENLLADGTGLDAFEPDIIRQLGELGRRHDAGDLRRFAPAKRYTLVACYLVEARKILLDHIVEMNDLLLTEVARQSRNTVEKQRKHLRRQAGDGLHQMLGAVDALMDADGDQTVAAFRAAVDAPKLAQAALDCRAYERLEQRGELDAMLSHSSVRALDAGARKVLTQDDPCGFVPADWRPYLVENGRIDRRIWELALALAVRCVLAVCSSPKAVSKSRSGI
jgi:Domain of unknown function (DUF4158)